MYKIRIPSFILQFLSARRVDQTAHVEIEGVALPQHDAGVIALAVMHGIILFAIGAAYLLNTIFNLFGKLRKNKNDD